MAYVFGRRKDTVFLKLKALLNRLVSRAITPTAGAPMSVILILRSIGLVQDKTQKIESKHINLRTRIKRLVRRTICFSKTERMHDLVIGLFINRYEFGRLL